MGSEAQGGTLSAEDTVQVKFILSGERARLKAAARERLEEAGWADDLRQICRDCAASRGAEAVTAAEIIEEVRSRALATVPDHIKAELLTKIKSTLESQGR